MSKEKKPITYANAGVDIQAGQEAVGRIKKLAARTFDDQVLSEIGSFGGFFKPDLSSVNSPVMIASADGVGTKLKLAFMTGRHNTVGEDLVNHCLNDILVHGAKGLFFLDYIGLGKLEQGVVEGIVEGLSKGCQENKVALLGGETAEMPGFYAPGEYDLAGFVVGLVDQDKIINGESIAAGDVCIGLASNGLHTNGYTLARKVAFEIAGVKPGDHINQLGMTIDEALMKVHTCYASIVFELLDQFEIKGMAHITGGGLRGNLNRILPSGVDAHLKRDSWPSLPIFEYLKNAGDLDVDDMYDAFNMGIGYVLVVTPDNANAILDSIADSIFDGFRIGEIVTGSGKVKIG